VAKDLNGAGEGTALDGVVSSKNRAMIVEGGETEMAMALAGAADRATTVFVVTGEINKGLNGIHAGSAGVADK
jgi:hypothetical protein